VNASTPAAGSAGQQTTGNAGGPAGPQGGVGAFYDPETASGRLGLAFKRAMVAVRRLRGRETQRSGPISYAQYGLLHGLAGACNVSARQLAEQTDLSPPTVAQMLEHLESAGLVRRTRSDQDRRVVISVLTERGAELVSERQRRLDEHWQGALASFSEQELITAAAVIEQIASVFESLSSEDSNT
jgi:DNA-binding MarR family transcriptional regulator